MDESNATCGKRLDSIGLENTEANRQAFRTLLVSAPGLGQYVSGAILFEETLYQSTTEGKKMVDVLVEQNIVPGIKVDKVTKRIDCRVYIPTCMVLNLRNLNELCVWNIRVWCHLLDPTMSHGAKD